MFDNEGRLNKYTCEGCNGTITTIDREAGVTPFMIRCRSDVFVVGGCGELMRSHLYRDEHGEAIAFGSPTYEWRKPVGDEIDHCSWGELQHVKAGGLLLFKINTTR